MSGETQRERAEHKANDRRSDDELWKGLLHEFFHDMLRSVLPEMARDADPNKEEGGFGYVCQPDGEKGH